MTFVNLLRRLAFIYHDHEEEEEFIQNKQLIVQEFLNFILKSSVILLIPLIIYLFVSKSLHLHGIFASAVFGFAIFLFLLRKYYAKRAEYILMIYMILIVTLFTVGLNESSINIQGYNSFYAGYAFALIQRTLGFRVVKISSMILLHLISLTLRLTLIDRPGYPILIISISLEILTIFQSIKSEKVERSSFDLLYNSKKHLSEFTAFLMKYLPHQMLILAKDYSSAPLINQAFQKLFKCNDIFQLKCSLKTLILKKEYIQDKLEMFKNLEYLETGESSHLNLSQFLWLLSKKIEVLRKEQVLSFQVTEGNAEENESYAKENFELKKEETIRNATFSEAIKMRMPTKSYLVEQSSSYFKENQSLYQTEIYVKSKRFTGNFENLSDNINHPDAELENDSKKMNRTFQVKIFILRWDNEETIAVMFDDITKREMVIESKLIDMNKNVIVSMASKELRPPINDFINMIDMAKQEVTDTKTLSYLGSCQKTGFILLNSVNSMIDMAKVRDHKLKLYYSRVSLDNLLNDLKSLFESCCLKKNLFFQVHKTPDLPEMFVTDLNRLKQILISLLAKAVESTFGGGVALMVQLEDGDQSLIRFTIQDTGLGVSTKKLKNLKKQFKRSETTYFEENSTIQNPDLLIANVLANLLSPIGKKGIDIQSEPGKGSVFSFVIDCSLPLCKTKKMFNNSSYLQQAPSFDDASLSFIEDEDGLPIENREAPYLSHLDKPLFRVRTHDFVTKIKEPFFYKTCRTSQAEGNDEIRRISDKLLLKDSTAEEISVDTRPWCLVVDDNPQDLIQAQAVLGEIGYRIKIALNGKEAVEKIMEHQKNDKIFKAILMDFHMPLMNGSEAVKILKQMMQSKEIYECPIVGFIDKDSNQEKLWKEAGISKCLKKPLRSPKVIEILKQLG